jgi:hypothetical protein
VQDFEEDHMPYAKRTQSKTRWISVPLDDRLHEEVRAQAVRRHMAWPDIIAEAVGLWLSAQTDEAA